MEQPTIIQNPAESTTRCPLAARTNVPEVVGNDPPPPYRLRNALPESYALVAGRQLPAGCMRVDSRLPPHRGDLPIVPSRQIVVVRVEEGRLGAVALLEVPTLLDAAERVAKDLASTFGGIAFSVAV